MPKPGRNLLCPCGSGIKYKKCVSRHVTRLTLSEADKRMAQAFLVEARRGQAFQAVAAPPVEPLRGETTDVCYLDDANFFGGT